MTDISAIGERDELSPAAREFVLRWGDLGTQWGMSRSVCQVHAFLYLQEKPRTADEIGSALGLARSNISTSLKELLAWDLIRRVPVANDRREHFEAEVDVWEIALRIGAGRKRREIDPALAALRQSLEHAGAGDNPLAVARIEAMLAFTQSVDSWYGDMLRLPRNQLSTLMKIGGKIAGFLPKAK